jgi:uncharacterized protein YcnI
MNRRTISTITLAGAVGLFLAVAMPMSASAHVEVDSTTTAAGGYADLTFSVPHGCDGSPTTAIAITIPDDVISVTPTINPGWNASKVTSATAADQTGQVVYTAQTPMPDGYRTTFTLSVPLPAGAEGDAVEFPVLQTCETGSTVWDEKVVEGGEEPEHPAPTIFLTAASADGHDHGAAEPAAAEATATATAAEDVVSRVFGIGGLLVGAVGVVLATVAIRRRNA